jgi:hypothetical protein
VPSHLEPVDGETLAQIVSDAKTKRGKRRTLRAPTPPRAIGDASMYARTRKHLRRLARRVLHDLAMADRPMPTPEALAEALEAYVWDRLDRHVYFQEPGEARRSRRERLVMLDGPEAVERVSGNAARYALRDPDEPARYVAEMRRRASVGGSKSKRRPEWERDPSKLDALAALMAAEPHLTVSKLADRLGVSPRTITNMRAVLRKRDA